MICLRHYMAFDTPKAFLDNTLLLLYILCGLLANRHGFGDGVGMVKALAGICLVGCCGLKEGTWLDVFGSAIDGSMRVAPRERSHNATLAASYHGLYIWTEIVAYLVRVPGHSDTFVNARKRLNSQRIRQSNHPSVSAGSTAMSGGLAQYSKIIHVTHHCNAQLRVLVVKQTQLLVLIPSSPLSLLLLVMVVKLFSWYWWCCPCCPSGWERKELLAPS